VTFSFSFSVICGSPAPIAARLFLEAVEALFGAAMFYYVARFVDSPALRDALSAGETYFAYSRPVSFSLTTSMPRWIPLTASLQEARDSGTLEPLLVTQVSLPSC